MKDMNDMNCLGNIDTPDTAADSQTDGGSAKSGRKAREFSKRTICAMTVLWFIGAVFGMAVTVWQIVTGQYSTALDSLLGYIGMPMTGGIVGYMVKTAVENREKVRGHVADRDIV